MKTFILLLTVLLALTAVAPAAEVLYYENPYEDAYVDDLSGTGTNDDTLVIQGNLGNGTLEAVARTLLKFDISSIPTDAVITSAFFGIYLEEESVPNIRYLSSSPEAELFYVAADNWTEDTVDWAFTEGLTTDSSTSFGTDPLTNTGQYIEWNLLDASGIDFTQIERDDYLSFLLTTTDESINNWALFLSSENEIYQPYLKVTYTNAVPAPGSITLAVIGLSSVMAIRRKKRSL